MMLKAALLGDLEKFLEEEVELRARSITGGVRHATEDLKHDLRVDVVRGGLGRRLSKSWRSKNFPGSGYSLGAAGSVYTKSPKLIRAFDEGTVIRSADGFWLAIPTEHAPKTGVGRKRINPSNFPEHSLGKLRFVYRPKVSLLVVDNQRERKGKRGGFAPSRSKRALKTGHGLSTVIMFFLVPQVRLKRRLNVAAIERDAGAQLPRLVDEEYTRLGGTRSRRR